MDKPIRKSLPRQIAEMIEQKIKNGEYQIGDKLPPEPMLVEIFGVSRNTVREAIQSLTNSGLLETRQGDGTYVVATERLQVEFYNIMNGTTYQNVLEVRDLLERHIVASAVKHCTEQDLQEIEAFLRQRNQTTGSIRENSQADLNFHMAIAKATHNDIIYSVYRYVSEYFSEFIYQKLHTASQDEQEIDRIHVNLYHAIRDRNANMALDCVSRIIEL